jgi:hypothetical protein
MRFVRDSEKNNPDYWLSQSCTYCGRPLSTYKAWVDTPMVPDLILMLHWVKCPHCNITNWMEDPDVPRC